MERVGIRKVEKIESDLPPIREVVKSIDNAIIEAEQLRLQAVLAKQRIDHDLLVAARARERVKSQKRIAEQKANQNPLEREYKQAFYGNENHDITSINELFEMNRFISTVESGEDKQSLLEKIKSQRVTALKAPEELTSKELFSQKLAEVRARTENSAHNTPVLELKSVTKAETITETSTEPKNPEELASKELFSQKLAEVRAEATCKNQDTPQKGVSKGVDFDR